MKFTSAEFAGASGSIGGTTFSRNRYGQYVRNRAVPVNPASAFQVAVRNIFADLASRWASVLTDAQRAAWTLYADNTPVTDALGNPITLTGMNMYIRTNSSTINDASLSIIDTAPAIFGLGTLTAPVVTQATTNLSVAYTNTDAWAITTGGALFVYTSRPQNTGINFFNGPYRFAGVELGDTATPPTSPLLIALTALPFPPLAGQKLFVRINTLISDGRLSSSWRGSLVIT